MAASKTKTKATGEPSAPADAVAPPAAGAARAHNSPLFDWALNGPAAPGGSTAEQAAELDRRQAHLSAEDEKLATLGLRAKTVSAPSHHHTGNQRREHYTVKLVVAQVCVTLALLACFAAMAWSFYQHTIQPQLQSLRSSVAGIHAPGEFQAPQTAASARAELTATQGDLAKAQMQIAALQKQMLALQERQEASHTRLDQFITKMQEALANGGAGTGGKSADVASTLSSALQVASVVPVSSPVTQELWLLKERNRLTFWADEAIAKGSSEAMSSLWRSLVDPELARVHDGVQAEIIRVQNYYSHLSRLPPDYRLPVRELFNNTAIRSEADLEPAQVIKLLLDPKQPVEVRARSAYVLGGRHSPEIAQALVQAMKNDPVLDVVKEAQQTLESDYGMRIPPLHPSAAEEWWKSFQSNAGK